MPSLRFAPYREIASEIAARLMASRDGRDALANAAGALAGAALGHARKSVRVRFDF